MKAQFLFAPSKGSADAAPELVCLLSIVGVPLLMIVFSVVVPALRNPAFLFVGALLGLLLPGSWVGGSRFDSRVALAAGLILVAVYFGLVLILVQT